MDPLLQRRDLQLTTVRESYSIGSLLLPADHTEGIIDHLSDFISRHVQEENEDEENLLDQLSSLLSAIIKKYGDAAMPLVDLLMPSVAPLLAPNRSAEERRIALCLLDDILEFSPAGARKSLCVICQLPHGMCAGAVS